MNSAKLIEAYILISGRVQGVGFRPFIYRLATRYKLKGYVINRGDAGVEVVLEGSEKNIKNLINAVKNESPSVSEINDVKIKYNPFRNRFNEFKIDKSKNDNNQLSGIFPPDIGICTECLKDMKNIHSRWYEYPFTACAWCGPRFTGIKSLPYDRERTHMDEFPLCEECITEYNDPLDRRFDAQGITCKKCGPEMSLFDQSGSPYNTEDIFTEVGKLLLEGKIIAVKGIGGIHLVSQATNDDVILKLRERKNRPQQPFALMSPNLEEILTFTQPNQNEIKTLTSWRKPIVLLKKKRKIISDLVAPGLDRIGVMLPYTGIQTMIFKKIKTPALVMTSGNPPGVPMITTNIEAFNKLNKIADYFLLHNRKIINRCDDTVLKLNNKNTVFLRRSRGYVPDPINIPINNGTSIAVGAEQSNTATIIRNDKAYLTQYLGDIDTLESIDFERKAIITMCDILKINQNVDVITCDNNPSYMTSHLSKEISQEFKIPLITSQHHHSHIVSTCAENKIKADERVIGIALDGAGYGLDSNIWGGEVIISTYLDFQRVGQLSYVPMPGGDLCALYPYRMLISALTKSFSDNEIRDITYNHIENVLPNGFQELEIILKQARNENTIKTSSSGRFLDSISALLGLCSFRTYEGEPAIKLEAHANSKRTDVQLAAEIEEFSNKYILKTEKALEYFVLNRNRLNSKLIAYLSQKYIVDGLSDIAFRISENENINKIAISGGVLINSYIRNNFIKKIKKANKKIILNTKSPCGDGGISLGQACIGLSNVI